MSEKPIDFNLKPTDLSSAKQLIISFLKLRRPVFLHGPIGVGKSDIIKQIAADQNRSVIDIRMSQMDLTDLRGIPFYNPDKKEMEWAPPSLLPRDPKATHIIFLDELNCASPSLQATAYQLILDRRVGDYILPEGVDVIAAGNRDTDKGSTFRMAAPLLNRFVHLEVKYDTPAWLEWAKKNSISTDVLQYIENFPGDLATFDGNASTKAFATPRTWKFVSDCLEFADSKQIKELVASCIGYDLAIKFIKWRDTNCRLNIDDIIAGKVKKLPGDVDMLSFMSTVVHTLCNRLSIAYVTTKNRNTETDRAHFNVALENSFKFILSNSKSHKDVPKSFLSLLTRNYNVVLNYEQLPSISRYVNAEEEEKFPLDYDESPF